MEIVVTGRHPAITPAMKRHARRKAEKLSRYFEGTQQVEMILDREGDQSLVELVISVARGGTIVSHCRDGDLYAAIDTVLDKAELQLTRYKEKLKDRRSSRRSSPRSGAAEERGHEAS